MNDLNAQQIVLLTLLVSFVTSIATGIVTVSLLEQAPEPVTQTINRIVEKTVERVVTEPSPETDDKPVEKEVVTVVVKEEDLTIEAVKKNSGSLVRLYEKAGDLKQFIALGIVINNQGEFIVDSSRILPRADYIAVYSNGEFEVQTSYKPNGAAFAILAPQAAEGVTGFDSATFGDSSGLQLGQTVIAIGGQNSASVSTGIVTQVEKTAETISSIDTSITSTGVAGTMFVTLKGDIVGMGMSAAGPSAFTPSTVVKEFLAGRTSATVTN
jgi:S1-C subfamily serine protease